MDAALNPVLTIGGAAIGGATGIAGALAQNKAIENSMQGAANNANTSLRQNALAAATQRSDRVRESSRVNSRIQLAAAEAGSGLGGSFLDLQAQNAVDTANDRKVIRINEGSNAASILSSYDATIQSLESRTQNPILGAFAGGLQGLSTGLSIIGAADSFSDLDREKQRNRDAREIIQ